jgi:Alpha/beta hydrolase domain
VRICSEAFFAVLASAFLFAAASGVAERASAADAVSCDDFLPPLRDELGKDVLGKKVGPSSCMSMQNDLTIDGRAYRRLDIGLNGSVEGYVAKAGAYKEYLTNAPDLVFPQTGNPGPLFRAVANYERDKGAAITMVFPRDPAAWNGKLFVTAHGRNRSFKDGTLKVWDKYFDPTKPSADLNKYDLLILAKGYALAKTYRTSIENIGEIKAVLEDGTAVDYVAFNESGAYIKDFAAVAKRAVANRLGRAASRTYLYGHSAGARIGRGMNYIAGVNKDADGKPTFDGMLLDDAASGLWAPVVMKGGHDMLLTTEAEKASFVPQLEVTHQIYNGVVGRGKIPSFVSLSYLENKRLNALTLLAKGLGDKHRMYEVRSISHLGGETLPDGRRGKVQILDLSLMMDKFMDMLDAWVDRGVPPPPTRSDVAGLGGGSIDNQTERPALSFPEVACPLGVYFPYPKNGDGTTSFAAFTGEGLEPVDEQKVYVDMNRNGVWDRRETPTQAWQRLGLLKKDEVLSREKYVACITQASNGLAEQGFFSRETARRYAQEAERTDLAPKSP